MPARLSVEITASEAKFREDLNRAVGHAERASKRIEGAFGGIKFTAIGAAIGLAIGDLASNIREIVSEAAKLDDLADATGSSVENLSKLNNQAKISGTSIETLSGLVLKLSAGMAGADDESSNVGRALKALGVNAKDPAEALQQVAVSLDKYADGIGKAAIARDLFGKGGPAFLATLKDIAQTQDVAATVTAKQAQEAEQLEKAFRRLSVEATTFKNAILSDVIPAINDLIVNFRLARQAGEDFFSALIRSGTNVSNIDDQIKSAADAVDNAKRAAAAGAKNPLRIFPGLVADQKDIDTATAKLKALIAIRDRGMRAQEDRGFDPRKPLDYTGTKDPKEGRAKASGKERISDAQRYLDNLEQQLLRTQDLTAVEKVLADVESGRLKLSNDVSLQSILNIAGQIDAQEALKKSTEALAKQEQEAARIREQTSKAKTKAQEQAQGEVMRLAEQNEAFRDEISLIGASAEKSAELEKARISRTIALKEETAAMLENAGGSEAEVSSMRDQIALLKERQQLIDKRSVAETVAKDLRTIADYNKIFVDSFAAATTGFVTGATKIGQAARQMERAIVGALTNIAAQKIGEGIFGGLLGGSSGGGIGGFFAKLFGDVGGGGIGSLFSGLAFASGGVPPTGKASIVGEHGPELFVPRQPGIIIPNDVLASRRAVKQTTINVNVNVLPGASTATADQAAMRTGIALQRAIARNG